MFIVKWQSLSVIGVAHRCGGLTACLDIILSTAHWFNPPICTSKYHSSSAWRRSYFGIRFISKGSPFAPGSRTWPIPKSRKCHARHKHGQALLYLRGEFPQLARTPQCRDTVYGTPPYRERSAAARSGRDTGMDSYPVARNNGSNMRGVLADTQQELPSSVVEKVHTQEVESRNLVTPRCCTGKT